MILQGGIGHFARLFGLSVDNIRGATVVLVDKEGTLVESEKVILALFLFHLFLY